MTKYDTLTTYNETLAAQDRQTRKVITGWVMLVLTVGVTAYLLLGCAVLPAWAQFCTTQCTTSSAGTYCTTYCT